MLFRHHRLGGQEQVPGYISQGDRNRYLDTYRREIGTGTWIHIAGGKEQLPGYISQGDRNRYLVTYRRGIGTGTWLHIAGG